MAVSDITSSTPSRAEQRKRESHAKILAAARQLFVEKGYHATRPQDIARQAGVGHGTFYLHFSDKQDCFLAFVEQAHEELETEIAGQIPETAGLEERIRGLLIGLFDYAERNPGVLAAAMADLGVITSEKNPRGSIVDRWAHDWAGALSTGIGVGEIYEDYDPRIVGHAIIGLIQGAARGGHEQRIGRYQVIENLTRFLVRALTPPSRDCSSSP